ncbi:type II toxin-antitoxin system PemK/MazF family toxin [Jiangella rhizosphaerae]|uniref:mRNA interferase n=1 Tax=Jiangella rhizosphaerae TaxID=2293569 RepID=A0A418KRU7_9ACTN|nr:type II toxin-antitoxin system PemK/MazF family toxin [Jiangella rhizosphaerae]RIQ26078.1 type II toxin-antitoxin system PemK/MazF family toxin [Jiangella rhizosphaerae]
MNRGDIYLADLGEPIGHEQALKRPVLIVSAQPWLESHPPVVTVLPLTRTYRQRSTHVEVEPGSSGLKATSYVKCEDIRAISPRRLGRYFGRADDATLVTIETILRRLLAL